MIIKTIGGVFVIALMFGPQLYGQYMFAGTASKINNIVMRTDEKIDPFAGKNLNVINHTRKGFFKRGYTALAQFNVINASRKVYFMAHVAPKKLLRPGEKLPAESLLKVFAKTHAIFYAQEECKRLLQTLASKCEVSGTTSRIEKDGVIRISGGMRFVQKTDFGSFDEKGRLAFQQIGIPLTRKNRPVQLSMSSAEHKRMSFYKKALKECSEIKRSEGNCALNYINIKSWRKPHSASIKISGKSYYSYLQALGS